MRVLVFLSNPVPAFQPTAEQLAALSARLVGHELVAVDSEAAFLEQLPAAEAVVVWRFPGAWYARAGSLRHVLTPAAGHEGFALDPAGRVLQHFGRFHGVIMAESLVGMLVFNSRRFGAALAAQAERRWDRAPFSACRVLRGQVVLIIGFGAIGQHAARLLSALGMVVHGLRRDARQPSPGAARVFSVEQRLEAVAGADHVVCILPGDTGTERFLDAEAFARMKPSACVYNIGRGNAIDAGALLDALVRGMIAGAFLDVVPEEPLPASSPLWAAPNLFLTPHASAISADYLNFYFEELAAELTALG
jgi:phosphoglycerate dehydrogenase-like enzyme